MLASALPGGLLVGGGAAADTYDTGLTALAPAKAFAGWHGVQDQGGDVPATDTYSISLRGLPGQLFKSPPPPAEEETAPPPARKK